MYTSLSKVHLFQATDGQHFEIETAALAHVACAPRESGILLTDFAAAYPCVNHSWIFHVSENVRIAQVHLPFPQKNLLRVHYTYGICRNASWTIPHGQECEARLPCERIPVCDLSTPSFVGSRTDHSQEPCWSGLPSASSVCNADDFAVAASSFRCLMTASAPAFRVIGSNCWAQFESSEMPLGAIRHFKLRRCRCSG